MNILMTVEELAKYLKIKPDTIYKKVRKGELPAVKLGKLLRFPKELIDQWVLEQAQKTAKARKVLVHKVEEVVGEVNKRAKVAGQVIGEDVAELIHDVKKAPLNKKQAAFTQGLKDLWKDLNRQVVKPPRKKTSSKKKSPVKKKLVVPARAPESQPAAADTN